MTGRLLALTLTATAGAVGCLDVPRLGNLPACESEADCPGAAICDQGLCWGDPPNGEFAAIAGPPSVRVELVTTETSSVELGQDGWLPDFVLERGVTLSGRIVPACVESMLEDLGPACDPASLPSVAANVVISRNSRLPGRAALAWSTQSLADISEGPSFTITVPRAALDEDYLVTVTPVRSPSVPKADTLTSAQRRIALTESVSDFVAVLGGSNLPSLIGTVVSSKAQGSQPMPGMWVRGRARWRLDGPLEELSNIAVTDADGRYQLRLPPGTIGTAEIVVAPPPDVVAPRVRRTDIELDTDGVTNLEPIELPSTIGAVTVRLPVLAPASSGGLVPVAGAQVILVAAYNDGILTNDNVIAEFTAEALTDVDGVAAITVLPWFDDGLRYDAVIVPPVTGDVALGTLIESAGSVSLGTTGLASLVLPERVAIRGQLVNADGLPLAGLSVQAEPAARFYASLSANARRVFDLAAPAGGVTDSEGRFVLWVDGDVDGQGGLYNLHLQPAEESLVPRKSIPGVIVGADFGADLGVVSLPPARFVRGNVRDADLALVPAADVRLYRLVTGDLCPDAATSCFPTRAEARGISDEFGQVQFVLPAE